ncbi:hypothetical protein FPOAC2_07726 [Fusarium poae]
MEEFIENGGHSLFLMEGAHMGAFIVSAIHLGQYGLSPDFIIGTFIRNPSIIREMKHMLTMQGLLSDGGLALKDQVADVFHSMLPLVQYNYRVTCFWHWTLLQTLVALRSSLR